MQPEYVIVPALFLMIGFITWTLATTLQRRQRVRALMEVNTRLIDRLGSVSDFSAFANTAAGSKFMESLLADAPFQPRPGERVLRSVQSGVVLVVLSLGLLSLGWYVQEAQQGFVIVGVILLSLGIGFLAAAAVAHRLASSLSTTVAK